MAETQIDVSLKSGEFAPGLNDYVISLEKLLMNQLASQHQQAMANQSRIAEYYNMFKFNLEQERIKKAQIEQQEKIQQFHQKMLLNQMLQRTNPMVSHPIRIFVGESENDGES